MEYQEKLKEILDGIRPQFEILGTFAFTGEGDDAEFVNAFKEAYEGYDKARALTKETFGKAKVELEEGQTWCDPTGGTFGEEDSEMLAAYELAKSMGMLPPPLMMRLSDFIFKMNHYFIAAQNL